MANYDFRTLSPHDFELLTRDLIGKELGIKLESFKPGKDGGIDLRHCSAGDGTLIVQCKHTVDSTFSTLVRAAERERPNLRRLRPKRFLFVTSKGLSPKNIDRLLSVLHPFCKSERDIYSSQRLNSLLTRFSSVEKQHFKLWLTSSVVLQRLLENGIFTRTNLAIEDIQRRLCLFVPTDAVKRASRFLSHQGYCLFAGDPGIGKTTTAQVLVAQHVEKGWECVSVSGDIEEAYRAFDREERQIFFYDDFLGQTSLTEKLQKNEDRRLVQLVQTCAAKRAKKRFVLTTRDYLLQQANDQHEILRRSEIELAKCVVSLEDYAHRIRAEILVNHLYFFGVKPAVYKKFVTSGQATASIAHPNYSPRVVETICGAQAQSPLSPKQFGLHFLQKLDNPREIWSDAFHSQLSVDARQVMRVFAIHGTKTNVDELRRAYRKYEKACGKPMVDFARRYRNALAELEGNFLDITPEDGGAILEYRIPAVKDFMDDELESDSDFLDIALEHFDSPGALLDAARMLSEHKDSSRLLELLPDMLQRAMPDEQQECTDPIGEGAFIIAWVELASRFKSPDLDQMSLEIICRFFGRCRRGRIELEPLIELFKRERFLSKRSKLQSDWTIDDFVGVFAGKTYMPDDFVSLWKMVQGTNKEVTYLDTLQDAFLGNAMNWLEGQAEDADSSQSLDDDLTSFLTAAKKLRIMPSDFSVSEIESRIESLESDEETEAAANHDDGLENIENRSSEDEEIESILGSLLG